MTQTEIAPMAAGSPDRLTGLKTFWHYFSVNRGAVIGLFVFILLVLAALFAPLLAPYLDVVKALNAIGATPQDLLAILQAMKAAGSLRAELEVI